MWWFFSNECGSCSSFLLSFCLVLALLATTQARDTAYLQIILYEPDSKSGKWATHKTDITGIFSRAGSSTSAEGEIFQIHPLNLCGDHEDGKLLEYGWVGVVQLEKPNSSPHSACPSVFGKAKRALEKGATAVIFDVSKHPGATNVLNSKYKDAVERPIVIIEGINAKKLMKLLRQKQVARARIQRKVTARETESDDRAYLNTIFIVAGIITAGLLCALLFTKRCRSTCWQSQTEMSVYRELTANALRHIHTRKYEKPVRPPAPTTKRNLSDCSSSTSSGSSLCAICLEEYVNGQELRVMPCSHEFHQKCLDPWLKEKYTCPLCNLNILENAVQTRSEVRMTSSDHQRSQQSSPTYFASGGGGHRSRVNTLPSYQSQPSYTHYQPPPPVSTTRYEHMVDAGTDYGVPYEEYDGPGQIRELFCDAPPDAPRIDMRRGSYSQHPWFREHYYHQRRLQQSVNETRVKSPPYRANVAPNNRTTRYHHHGVSGHRRTSSGRRSAESHSFHRGHRFFPPHLSIDTTTDNDDLPPSYDSINNHKQPAATVMMMMPFDYEYVSKRLCSYQQKDNNNTSTNNKSNNNKESDNSKTAKHHKQQIPQKSSDLDNAAVATNGSGGCHYGGHHHHHRTSRKHHHRSHAMPHDRTANPTVHQRPPSLCSGYLPDSPDQSDESMSDGQTAPYFHHSGSNNTAASTFNGAEASIRSEFGSSSFAEEQDSEGTVPMTQGRDATTTMAKTRVPTPMIGYSSSDGCTDGFQRLSISSIEDRLAVIQPSSSFEDIACFAPMENSLPLAVIIPSPRPRRSSLKGRTNENETSSNISSVT